MNAVVRHVRSLWPDWRILTPLPFVLHGLVMAARGLFRWDHAAVMIGVPALAYATAKTKKLYVGLYPIGLVGLFYEWMRDLKDVGVSPATVHVCDLRAIELRLFGIGSGAERITLQDWFQAHPSKFLDGLCAFPYGTFIFASFAFAAYGYFKDFGRMQRFTWAFLAMNVAAFLTYHLYPAAPPWYFHAHGCTVDMTVHASEGPNLARVDQMLGFGYFAGLYGRASDIFGAVPSLHVAYPMLIAIEGWAIFRAPLRVVSIAYFALMCFSAVYLDHHWVVDVCIGIAYASVAFVTMRAVERRLTRPRAAFDEAAVGSS